MKNFVQPGDTITVAAPYALDPGAGAQVESIFGVANGAAASGATVDLTVVGVFDLPKVSTDAFSVGAPVYWDDTAKLATSDDEGGNIKIGVVIRAAGNPSALVRLRLSGAF